MNTYDCNALMNVIPFVQPFIDHNTLYYMTVKLSKLFYIYLQSNIYRLQLSKLSHFTPIFNSLITLNLSKCFMFDITFTSKLSKLKELYINGCYNCKYIGGLSNLPVLSRLDIQNCPCLQYFDNNDVCKTVKILYLCDCGKFNKFSSLVLFEQLEVLFIQGNNYITNIEYILELVYLHTLQICYCCYFKNISNIHLLQDLNILNLGNNMSLRVISPLSLSKITSLSIRGLLIGSMGPIGDIIQLKELDISDCFMLSSLSSLSSLINLQKLVMVQLTMISSLDFIFNLSKLEHLDISRCSNLTSLNGISVFTKLKYINMSHTQISNIQILNTLPQLEYIYMNTCRNITNLWQFTTLSNLDKLQLISLKYCINLKCNQGIVNILMFTKIDISHC